MIDFKIVLLSMSESREENIVNSYDFFKKANSLSLWSITDSNDIFFFALLK